MPQHTAEAERDFPFRLRFFAAFAFPPAARRPPFRAEYKTGGAGETEKERRAAGGRGPGFRRGKPARQDGAGGGRIPRRRNARAAESLRIHRVEPEGGAELEKHILILTTTKDFLGKFEQENVRLLQEMGYVVHYATNRREPAYLPGEQTAERLGVPVHHIEIARSPFMLENNEKALRQLLWLLRRYPIRAIHCHTPVGGLLGRLAGRLCPEKDPVVIYTAHGFHFYKGAPVWNHLAYYPVERWLARYTDILVVINREDYRTARRFRLKKGGLVYQIPGVGLNRERFRPLSAQERRLGRQRLGIGEDAFFLVSVGELNENKNQRVVLEALAGMKARGEDFPRLRYGICGDGFFRERIKGWIRELGLADTVILYGHRRDIPAVLGCADAAVFPSIREGLGMAGLEALAMGIPVVASDNRGTREYMEPGKNGFVCPPHDVEGFIRGIEAVRRMPEEAKREMAAFCRESTEPFDIRHAREAMREIYAQADRLVRAGRGARPRHGALPIRLAAGRRKGGKRPALPEAEERAVHKEAAGPWETP